MNSEIPLEVMYLLGTASSANGGLKKTTFKRPFLTSPCKLKIYEEIYI